MKPTWKSSQECKSNWLQGVVGMWQPIADGSSLISISFMPGQWHKFESQTRFRKSISSNYHVGLYWGKRKKKWKIACTSKEENAFCHFMELVFEKRRYCTLFMTILYVRLLKNNVWYVYRFSHIRWRGKRSEKGESEREKGDYDREGVLREGNWK